MLNVLREIETRLLSYIDDANTEYSVWQSLDITYEKPHVERVWMPYQGYRIYLHRIHTCSREEALWHPHPWPSAMLVVDGEYEMGIGYGNSLRPPVAATVVLGQGSRYEMVEANAWHYVRPVNKPVLSLMVTGLPWKQEYSTIKTALPPKQPPLNWQTEQTLFKDFARNYESLRWTEALRSKK